MENRKKKNVFYLCSLLLFVCFIFFKMETNQADIEILGSSDSSTITEEQQDIANTFSVYKEGLPGAVCSTQTISLAIVYTIGKELNQQTILKEILRSENCKIQTHYILLSSLSFLSLQEAYGYYTYRQG